MFRKKSQFQNVEEDQFIEQQFWNSSEGLFKNKFGTFVLASTIDSRIVVNIFSELF